MKQKLKEEDRQKIEEEAYLLWEACGKPEGKDEYYWTLAKDKIKTEESKTEESWSNKVKKFLVNNLGQILVKVTILAAFGAFALSMRQKEFDRFSLVKPVFEVKEELENKKFKLSNHNGLVVFVGCNQKYRNHRKDGVNPNHVLFNKLKTTPKQYSSLSKGDSLEFIFKKEIKINEYFICYYRDVDENLYELGIVYRKNRDTNTNSKSFYIIAPPDAYRSDLFVTMSRKWLDTIVSFIFPKDWYKEHENLKDWFNECKAYRQEEYKLSTIDECLTVKYR